MHSAIFKHSIVIDGLKTSISLEDDFWVAFKVIADSKGVTLGTLIEEVKQSPRNNNISSSIRLYVLGYFIERADEKTRKRLQEKAALRRTRGRASRRAESAGGSA